MQLTGSQVIIECLKEQGVDTVFGYPGGAILNVYDELYKHPEIRHVLTSHEQGASHAADGYARSTGKVGVCMATSGPGATNLVTGIATAYMDSIPIVAITCNVGVSLLGKDSFQEIDIAGITTPITKYSFIVKDVTKLADTIRRAFSIARKGRPGPVLVDITKDVTANKTEYIKKEPKMPQPDCSAFNEDDLRKAIQMIEKAKKPYIFVGGGAILSGASEVLKTFVEKTDAPVCDTLMGKGAYDGTSENYTGMLGMHGTKTSNLGVSECDLLIVVGARFSDRVAGDREKFGEQAKIVQLDIDEKEINKNVKVDEYILGDIKEILIALTIGLDRQNHPDWLAKIEEWKHHFDDKKLPECDLPLPQQVLDTINEIKCPSDIIATDVGQHQMWVAQFSKIMESRTLLTSGGMGTMGYGMGAAIGAQCARPNDRVCLITGDGSFHMNLNELVTLKSYELPVVVVVMNNTVLGMVRQWQKLFYGSRFSQTDPHRATDFVKLANAFGVDGLRITKPEEIKPILTKAFEMNKPVVVDCHISPDANVLPMIPPGKTINEIITEM